MGKVIDASGASPPPSPSMDISDILEELARHVEYPTSEQHLRHQTEELADQFVVRVGDVQDYLAEREREIRHSQPRFEITPTQDLAYQLLGRMSSIQYFFVKKNRSLR